MTDSDQERYAGDEQILAQIGKHLFDANIPPVEVRLPRALADLAVAAWTRDDEGSLGSEDSTQIRQRRSAATLALIGLSIETNGRVDGEAIVVPLDPGLIGNAFNSVDDLT